MVLTAFVGATCANMVTLLLFFGVSRIRRNEQDMLGLASCLAALAVMVLAGIAVKTAH